MSERSSTDASVVLSTNSNKREVGLGREADDVQSSKVRFGFKQNEVYEFLTTYNVIGFPTAKL